MKPAGCILLALILLLCHSAHTQQPEVSSLNVNWRKRVFAIKGDSLQLDTVSIIPATLTVSQVPASCYQLDPATALLIWNCRPLPDSIEVSYRVFPFLMSKVQQRIFFDSAVAATTIRQKATAKNQGTLFKFGNMVYSGSFTRGLSFGNNQDAVVQSNFNLQLNGMLADSIQIAAAISDNNLPLQPDGSTRQLNEFDQVQLQFRKKHWQLNLGDLDLRQNDLYFLNFYKRLQGISFQTDYQLIEKLNGATQLSGSIAKGKFNRNIFQGREGNQGPYRLSGANGELFFMVLANTERVWMDGRQLERGEDADYTINYNTAEVVFMPRRMVTKDSRIQVEFEYADRNYLNANLFAQQKFDAGEKLQIQLAVFSNQDAKNAPINQSLSAEQKKFLYLAGDSLQQTFYPDAVLDTSGKEKVLYEKIYLNNGAVPDSFYRYSTNHSVARYALSFTDMGEGKGNYLPDFTAANGKVFQYISPVNGIKQGRYEPGALLIPPKKQQLISLGATYQPNQHHSLTVEAAASNYDPNSLSPGHGNKRNTGIAGKMDYQNTFSFQGKNKKSLTSMVHAERVQANFRPLERLRSVEFSREWGLPIIATAADESLIKAGTALNFNALDRVNYQFTAYSRGADYQGYQNQLQQHITVQGWRLHNNLLHTRYASGATKGTYFHPSLSLQKTWVKLGGVQAEMHYEQEQNKVRSNPKDTLSSQSFAFSTYTVAIRSGDKWANRYALQFFTRADQQKDSSKLVNTDRSYNLNFQAELVSNPRHQFVLNTTYRQLEVYKKTDLAAQNDRTLLGRAEYQVHEWNGLLTGNVLYEMGTGQEQRRDLTFIEVPSGQGEYTWVDYNKDGIQQINEFEVAQFRDQASFVRVMLPTNDYVKAAYNNLNYSFQLQPKAAWLKPDVGSLRRHLARYQLQSSFQTSRKILAAERLQFKPWGQTLNDTALIHVQATMGNTLSFNRQSSIWGIDLSTLQTAAKILMSYGMESRKGADWNLKGRLMMGKRFSLDMVLRQASQSLTTPVFANRNYAVETKAAEPRVGFISGTVFRLQGSYRMETKQNEKSVGGQRSKAQVITIDSRYNALQNSSISGRLVFSKIAFNDEPGTPVAYFMLDGLLPGGNMLWNLEMSRRLLNNVELNLSYDGRQPAGSKTVHTGRASLRALF